MSKTAMAEAFERVGFNRAEMEFHAAIARYFKAGGTKERAMELVEGAADKLLGEAMNMSPQGRVSRASAQQSESDAEGHGTGAESAALALPSALPHLTRVTLLQQGYRAQDGQFRPKPQTQSAIAASVRAAESAAVTILETFRVRDGRGIGDVFMSEISELRASSIIEASVLVQIQRHAAYDPTTNPRVRDVVKVSELQRMLQRAAEVADAS